MKAKADELAEAGFAVLAPDLNDGVIAQDIDHAGRLLLDADMNVTASLVQSSLRLLRGATASADVPLGIIGYSSGASWALWLSERLAEHCQAVVAFYGTQSIDFEAAQASYLLHFAADDDTVEDDDVALLGLNLQLARREFRIQHHEGVKHGFAEAHHPEYDAPSESAAWRRSIEFLTSVLRPAV